MTTIHLSWNDPTTDDILEAEFALPVTIGRGKQNTLVLSSSAVSRDHARLEHSEDDLVLYDLNTTNGTLVKGERIHRATLNNGDSFQIGPFIITAITEFVPEALSDDMEKETSADIPPDERPTHAYDPDEIARMTGETSADDSVEPPEGKPTAIYSPEELARITAMPPEDDSEESPGEKATTAYSPEDMASLLSQPADENAPTRTYDPAAVEALLLPPSDAAHVEETVSADFPPACFEQKEVSIDDLKATGLPIEEIPYLTIGGGIGSFIWADNLVIRGVDPSQIVAMGYEARPYGRFQRLAINSQIPDYERLRSDSGSTPDNIWGWPGYAVREILTDIRSGKLLHAARLAWQIFSEPTLSESFTPISGRVFASIDREAARINWDNIWRYGRVRAVRKTTDGRYVAAYSQTQEAGKPDHKFIIGQYVYVAAGYPGMQMLPDLKKYRVQTGDFKHVVNAYEDHNHVYDALKENGGTVLIRGRGIVASRIIQRIYELRRENPNIKILHLLRSPIPEGHRFGHNQRMVDYHWELQPYNWPKSTFGGTLGEMLANASENTREQLYNDWGGTTTADRMDWRRMIHEGVNQGWYEITFGAVSEVQQHEDGCIATTIRGQAQKTQAQLIADYVIDATGLNARIQSNPLLGDMIEHYDLKLNIKDRLHVEKTFEAPGMKNGTGRLFVAGAMVFGGHFAATDSYLGLQYSAQETVRVLTQLNSPGLKSLNPLRSVTQWIKWARGVKP